MKSAGSQRGPGRQHRSRRILIKRVMFVLSSALVTVAIAACGSSSSSSSSSSGSSGSTGGATTSAAAAGTSTSGGSATGSTWTIGVLNDATGVDAVSGPPESAGINYFVNQTNKSGGIDGHKLALKFCDTTSTPQGGAQCAQQLANLPSHVVLSLSDDPVTRGALPYLAKDLVVSIDTVLLPPTNTNAFQAVVPVPAITGKLMSYLKADHIDTLGVIYTTDTTGTKQYEAAQQSAKAAGIKVVGQPQTPGVTDVSPQLLKLKSDGAQAIFMANLGANTIATVSSYKTLSLTIPLVGGGAVTTDSFLKALSAGIPQNFYGISLLVTDPSSLPGPAATAWKQYLSGYKAANGEPADNETTTPQYGGCMIAAALKGTHGGTTAQMSTWLKGHTLTCLGSPLKVNVPGFNVVTGQPVQLAEAGSSSSDGWGAPSGGGF
jgi:branched-chain amino acid transport system substrate-binding protein